MIAHRSSIRRRSGCIACGFAFTALLWQASAPCSGHVFVAQSLRAGAYPPYDGGGWFGEAFLDLPNFDLAHFASLHACLAGPDQSIGDECRLGDLDEDGDADLRDVGRLQVLFFDNSLVRAERFLANRSPDFTFRTKWIDFPAGPVDSDLDANFDTVGDLLDDYIYDVSDQSKLDEPFGTLLLRFSGLVSVRLEDEIRVRDYIALPVWIDYGIMGYDGYRLRVGVTVYRLPNVNWIERPFYNFGPSIEVLGLYPIEITYFNSYDPEGVMGNSRAGVEVYSWHGGGAPWPAGDNMVHEIYGPATLAPPWVIYQESDIKPAVRGDFDADYDIDLRDVQWYQFCSDPSYFFLPSGCDAMDLDSSGRIDEADFAAFQAILRGPGVPSDGARP